MELNKVELYLNYDFGISEIRVKISVLEYKTWVF